MLPPTPHPIGLAPIFPLPPLPNEGDCNGLGPGPVPEVALFIILGLRPGPPLIFPLNGCSGDIPGFTLPGAGEDVGIEMDDADDVDVAAEEDDGGIGPLLRDVAPPIRPAGER